MSRKPKGSGGRNAIAQDLLRDNFEDLDTDPNAHPDDSFNDNSAHSLLSKPEEALFKAKGLEQSTPQSTERDSLSSVSKSSNLSLI